MLQYYNVAIAAALFRIYILELYRTYVTWWIYDVMARSFLVRAYFVR